MYKDRRLGVCSIYKIIVQKLEPQAWSKRLGNWILFSQALVKTRSLRLGQGEAWRGAWLNCTPLATLMSSPDNLKDRASCLDKQRFGKLLNMIGGDRLIDGVLSWLLIDWVTHPHPR